MCFFIQLGSTPHANRRRGSFHPQGGSETKLFLPQLALSLVPLESESITFHLLLSAKKKKKATTTPATALPLQVVLIFLKNELVKKIALPQRSVKFQTKSINVTTHIIGRNVNLSVCTLLMHVWNGGKFHTFLN